LPAPERRTVDHQVGKITSTRRHFSNTLIEANSAMTVGDVLPVTCLGRMRQEHRIRNSEPYS